MSDWRDLDPAMRAMVSGKITFSRFAELGRQWLGGASLDDIEDELPQSNTLRIVRFVRQNPGLLSSEVDAALGLRDGMTVEMCGRLRKRGQVRTVVSKREKDNGQIRVYPL